MSKRKEYTAIVPQVDWKGSLLFRFAPSTGLQCYADGKWYSVSTGSGSTDTSSYSFQQPVCVDGGGTIYLETASSRTNSANKVVVTDATGRISEDLLPVSIVADTWTDLT